MPRQPATVERDIPLFFVPHIVMWGIRTQGEELERGIVRKTRRHSYNVSIGTRSIKRELKRGKKYASGTPEADIRVDGEDTGGREVRETWEDGGEWV